MKTNSFIKKLRFHRQLHDYLCMYSNELDEDTLKQMQDVQYYIESELYKSGDLDVYYDAVADKAVSARVLSYNIGYDSTWLYNSNLVSKFLDEYSRYVQKINKTTKVEIIEAMYNYKNNTVTITFTNDTKIIMNALTYFMIESKIKKMNYNDIIKYYALEVITLS